MKELTISWNEASISKQVEETESNVYKTIGEILPSIPIPNRIEVMLENYGRAVFVAKARGSFVKNGIKMTELSSYMPE